jgi:hypothetical protein
MDVTSLSCASVAAKKRLHVAAYACQVFAIFTVIVACLVNLSLGNEKEALWASLLSGALGYMLPNPKIRKDDSFLHDPSVEQLREVLPPQHGHPIHNEAAEDDRSLGVVGNGISGNVLQQIVVYDTEE